MKPFVTFLLWFLFQVTHLSGLSEAAPRSGFLHTRSYQVNKDGNVQGTKTSTRTYFQGPDTRTETWNENRAMQVQVEGSAPWTAYPSAQCVMETPQHEQTKLSFPVLTRRSYHHLALLPRTLTTLKGFRCWQLVEHVKEVPMSGCIPGFAAHDVTYWVYPSEDFPLILQTESSLGHKTELVELNLQQEVPKSLFMRPQNFTTILPFKLPASFEIETEEETITRDRSPTRTVTTESYKGDGNNITRYYFSVTRHGDGRETNFHAVPDVTRQQSGGWLKQLMSIWEWPLMTKAGEETLPLGQAEIFEKVIDIDSRERYWIINQRVLGSIIAKQLSTSKNKTVTRRITKLEAAEPSETLALNHE